VVEVSGRRNSRPTRTDTDFGKTTKISNADQRSLGPKEKENGKLARILSKKRQKKEKHYYL
jgi:hypothetical protein